MGKKPIYYTVQNGTLYFASELSALFAALPHKPEVNLEAIDLYLSLQYIPDPLTAYQGVHKLPPAHRLIWQHGEANWSATGTAYQPKHTASEGADRATAHPPQRICEDAPDLRSAAGGAPERWHRPSIIVALMAELSNARQDVSVGFEEQSFSELEYARAVAQRYSTDHHEFILKLATSLHAGEDHLSLRRAVCGCVSHPLYHISKMTREHVTVVINGDGGDEDFAGTSATGWTRSPTPI